MELAEIQYTLEQPILDYIAECLEKEHSESYLISVLHKVQSKYGYLCQAHMEEVALALKVPASTVSGVATFYHFFRLTPKGKFSISVCLGTACFVKGANLVLDAFKNELGIDMGETTSDGIFSIEATRCIGVCAMAPVVTINDKIYSHVEASQVADIIMNVQSANK